MTALRLSRWIVLLAALIGCVVWSYVAIDKLLDNSMDQKQRASQYGEVPMSPSVHLHQLDLAQQRWGRQSLFAVACSFFFLLAVMMNWVLDGRPRRQVSAGKELR